ncbi:hypothetical protein GWK41_03385 [Persephonella atlantica]|uniref:Translocation and assembly module TamB C-terminal domain-containing protein n=1 Tax=Persephonella atlantica TaxID=2699429 RepID=A0ABS1GGR3_9AQUI|nr:translocation/assembly module TamB domain-containing protein [Persephonella atlantica]MBK3332109.1 hypothetical protein [Persephonella atlantica]
MKKFIINTFFILSITTLLISLILLTLAFLWENRSVIAKNIGIELKDDCKISDSQLQCRYINVSSKGFSIELRKVKLKLDTLKFFKKNEPFVFVSIDRGKIYIKIKKRKKKGENPLNYAFFLIYFVKSDINRLDIYTDLPSGRLSLEDFSFFSSYNSFYIKRPFRFVYREFSGTVTEFSGIIQSESVSVKKLKVIINGNILSGWGNFDYEENFSFKGNFEGKQLTAGSISLEDFHIMFSANRYSGILTSTSHIISGRLKINSFYATNIKGSVRFSGKNRFDGKLQIKADSIYLKKIKGKNAYFNGRVSFSIKKRVFQTEGGISVASAQYDKLSAVPVSSNINAVYKDKKFTAKGSVALGEVPLQFSYTDKILTVSSKGLSLKQVTRLYRPIAVDGTVWGKAVINFKNMTVSADLDGENFNIYGITFRNGKILFHFSSEKKNGRFSVNLKNMDSFCFINGRIYEKNIDADVTFDNLSTEGFIYGKRYYFGGVIDGTGKIYGSIPDLSVNLQGTAHSFYYRSIHLKDTQFQFLFENVSKSIKTVFKTGNTNGLLALHLKPFSLHLSLDFKNSDLSVAGNFLKERTPSVFSHITPKTATGTVKVSIENKSWSVKTEIERGIIILNKLKQYVMFSMKGNFSNKKKFFEASFYRKNFAIYNHRIKEISGNVSLSDGKIVTIATGKGLEDFDDMELHIYSGFELENKKIEGRVKLFIKKDDFTNRIDSTFSGNIKNIKGFLKERGYRKKKPAVKTDISYSVSVSGDTIKADVKTDLLSIILPKKTRIQFYKISGQIKIPSGETNKAEGKLIISSFTVSRNYLYFFESSPLKVKMKDGIIESEPVHFSGIITGKIERFSYDIRNNKFSIYSDGKVDRNLLSVIAQYLNTSGGLKYRLSFNGKLKDLKKKLYLSIFSEDLELKTSYTIGVIKLQKILIELSEGIIKLDINGKTTDTILGESIVRVKGNGNVDRTYGSFSAYTRLFPVKFRNIFQGNINSNLKLKLYQKDDSLRGNLKGKILVSGKLKLEKNLDRMVKGKNEAIPVKSPEYLGFLSLDISLESYIPLYLYGKWGKAYAEFDLKVKGTGKDPYVNGNVSIIYGEIYFMKNRYSIDFANIKIVNNEPYISARVSTSVADTFIFIDISGSAYNPKINFFSSPPRSKNEILSILLLKDTPSALENMPVFKTVGKLLYTLLPFKPQEETGLFNTGFEVNILPQYSPSTGISASIYGKRNLTRRIFIALSKPLGQVEEEKIGGWYGVGIKLKERTSFQYKFFETGNQEFGIVFNLPFDF